MSKKLVITLAFCILAGAIGVACAALQPAAELAPKPPAQPNLSIDHKGLPAIVWYFAPWCGYCKAMYPTILEAEKRFGSQLYILVVDTDDKRNRELIKKYRLESGGVPYTQFYDKKGVFIDDLVGAVPQADFFGLLSQHYKLK